MTSLPQTHRLAPQAQEGRRTPPIAPPAPEVCAAGRGRSRQALPAVDPSTAFGCVDWFLYPDPQPMRVSPGEGG